jgi:hypothetical protein
LVSVMSRAVEIYIICLVCKAVFISIAAVNLFG